MTEPKITAAELLNGNVRWIQGGSETDWSSPGTTNSKIETKDIQIQEGVAATPSNGNLVVTFPEPFANIPRIHLTVNSSVAGTTCRKIEETKTGFKAIVEKPGLNLGSLLYVGIGDVVVTWSAKGLRVMP